MQLRQGGQLQVFVEEGSKITYFINLLHCLMESREVIMCGGMKLYQMLTSHQALLNPRHSASHLILSLNDIG